MKKLTIALGGSYISPVTLMPCAIEIGDFMYEHASSEKLVPIISVTLDRFGNVVPVRILNNFKNLLSRKNIFLKIRL